MRHFVYFIGDENQSGIKNDLEKENACNIRLYVIVCYSLFNSMLMSYYQRTIRHEYPCTLLYPIP